MTLEDFRSSLGNSCPPDGCTSALAALWHDAKGDWEEAHRIAQAVDDEDGAWVHAYLHRKEGDSSNARHWYRRAARKFAEDPLPGGMGPDRGRAAQRRSGEPHAGAR